MTKQLLMLKILLAAMIMSVLPTTVYAQEESSELTEEDSSGASRPVMPSLFYSNEQRRILEILRQGYIASDSALEFEEYAPLVLVQEELVITEENPGRGQDLQINAFIRNTKTGKSSIWINGQERRVEDLTDERNREGLVDLNIQRADDGSIIGDGIDSINRSRFQLRVGQTLEKQGEISETYPIVIVKKQQ